MTVVDALKVAPHQLQCARMDVEPVLLRHAEHLDHQHRVVLERMLVAHVEALAVELEMAELPRRMP